MQRSLHVGVTLALGAGLAGCAGSEDSAPEPGSTPGHESAEENPATEPAESSDDAGVDETEPPESGDAGGNDQRGGGTADDGADQNGTSEDLDADAASDGEFGSERQTSEAWPGSASEPNYLTEIRAARHDGFDRVVFEHEGSPAPEYLVEYTDEARTEGTGVMVNAPGSVILAVGVSGVMPPEQADAPDHGEWLPEAETVIAGVHATAPWEGHAQYYVGLDSEREFRVTALEDPARIVVDIAH